MTSLPASSLVETVANKIKQMILSGSLVNILPGERELGHRLSVGRETIRKALALLERDAWIAPPRIKVPRRILKTTEEETVKNIFCHPVQEKKEILGFLTPQPLKRLAQSVLAEIYTISKILEEDGISVRIFEAPWILGNNPDKRLAKLVTKSECVCWILHRSSEQTQLWFKTHRTPLHCARHLLPEQQPSLSGPPLGGHHASCGAASLEQGASNGRPVPAS